MSWLLTVFPFSSRETPVFPCCLATSDKSQHVFIHIFNLLFNFLTYFPLSYSIILQMKRENEESVDEAKEKSEEVSNGVHHAENGSHSEPNGVVPNGVNGSTPASISPNNDEKPATSNLWPLLIYETLVLGPENGTLVEIPQTPPVQGFHNVKSQEHNASNSQNNEIVPLSKPTDSHKKKEIYRYTSKEPLFSCAWSNKTLGESFRLAICTCKDDDEGFEDNKISILEYDESKNELVERCSFHHGFPASCMMFNPSKPNASACFSI